MASHIFKGYNPLQFTTSTGSASVAPGDWLRLDPEFDSSRDTFRVEVTDDDAVFDTDSNQDEVGNDANQTGAVYDASGSLLHSGQIYIEHRLTVTDGAGQSHALYIVEIGGHLKSVLADPEIVPGTSYTITAAEDPGASGAAPLYSSMATPSFDPDLGQSYQGGTLADTHSGGAGGDTILSGAGDDSADGGAGDDLLLGGAGNDSLQGGAGRDTLDGGAGHDTLDGGAGDDSLTGGAGDDRISGGTGDDTVGFAPGWGTDTVDGGSDPDGADRDMLDFSGLGTTPVTVRFTANETGEATDGTNTAYFTEIEGARGGAGDDSMAASLTTSGVALDGQGGSDTLTGGSGDDTMQGGAGGDRIVTGNGGDTIVFRDGEGADTIVDFDLSDTDLDGRSADQLDVSQLTALDGHFVKIPDVTVSDDGLGNAVLGFPGGESLTLIGIAPAQITPAQLSAMGVPCFARGTRIETPSGPRAVESLRPGAAVVTLDQGAQPVLWHGCRRLGAADLARAPRLRPVRIRAGMLGQGGDLLLSPQHGVLLCHEAAPGGRALARAGHLAALGHGGIRIAAGRRQVSYHHLLLPRHAILIANGVPCESFYPGRFALAALPPQALAALLRLRPAFARILAAGPETTVAERLYGPPVARYLPRRALSRAALRPFPLAPLRQLV